MAKYRLKTGTHTVHTSGDPLVYTAGERGKDILDLTKEQADRFDPGRLEEISTSEAKREETQDTTTIGTTNTSTADSKPKGDTTTAPRPETEWTAVLSQGVQDVRGVVAALDNPDDLKALQREEEKSGSPRKMVLDAIEKRLGELKK
jgi:hypothetical protein